MIAYDRRPLRERMKCANRRLSPPGKQGGFILNPFRFGATETGPLAGYLGGLWGAYALQQLLSTATVAIRVRRSSDNTEQDIGFVGTVLDTASLLAFVGAGDGFVSKWYDQSGAANDFVQATLAAQPKLVDSGSYIGEILFDGLASSLQTANSSTAATPAFTCYVAGRQRIGGANVNEVIYRNNNGFAQLYSAVNSSASQPYFGKNLTGSSGNLGTNFVNSALNSPGTTIAAVHNLAASGGIENQATIWFNGVQQTSVGTSASASSGTFTSNTWLLGTDTTNFSRLALQAFVIYETAHSSTTIGDISTLLQPQIRTDALSVTSGLWALYGLSRIVSGYAGSCIRVRRSSDNTEQDIGFSGGLLDTAALLTFCGAGNGFIRKWYDQSGNARDAVQATSGNQPRIVNAGVVDVSSPGIPGILFTSASSQYLVSSVNSTARATMTTLYKFKMTGDGQHIALGAGAYVATNYGFMHYTSTQNLISVIGSASNSSNYTFRSPSPSIAPAGQVVGMRGDRGAASNNLKNQIFSGGRLVTTSNALEAGLPTGNFNANPWGIGIGNAGNAVVYANGYFSAVAIYEAYLSDADVERASYQLG